MKLRERNGRVRHVAEPERNRDHSEGLVIEGQRRHVRDGVDGRPVSVAAPPVSGLAPRALDHRLCKVHAVDLGAHVGERLGKIPRPARRVKHPVVRPGPRERHRPATPRLVAPKGVHAVVQVIAIGDRAEHPADAVCLVGCVMRVIGQIGCGPDRSGR